MNGYHGIHAIRDSLGVWQEYETPMPAAVGGLVHDGSDGLEAVIDDGAYHTSHWVWDKSAWKLADEVVGYSFGESLARNNEGELYVPVGNSDSQFALATWRDGWTYEDIETSGYGTIATVTLRTSGSPVVVYWYNVGFALSLKRWEPGGPSTIVHSAPSNWLDNWMMDVVDQDIPGQPTSSLWVLFDAHLNTGERSVQVNVEGHSIELDRVPTGMTGCSGTPKQGDVCNVDYEMLRPISLAKDSSQEVYALWARIHFKGKYTGVCENDDCEWEGKLTSDGDLWAACIDDQSQLQRRKVLSHTSPWSARGVVADGAIHLALYDSVDPETDPSVRYVQVRLP